MNLTLRRTSFTSQGVFGILIEDLTGDQIAFTLEHAYRDITTLPNWLPKLAPGTYVCKRGMHKLEHMTDSFETFAITGVPDFMGNPVTNILFHVGNWQYESKGCILLGDEILGTMICHSRITFDKFMAKMAGLDEFNLTVKA